MRKRMKTLDERVKEHPTLKIRFEAILDIAENSNGDCVKANDVEKQVIEEVRKLGQETIQDWANGQNTQQTKQVLEKNKRARPYKKTLLEYNLWSNRSARDCN